MFSLSSSLTFVFNPSSRVYGYDAFELKSGGENEVCIKCVFFVMLQFNACILKIINLLKQIVTCFYLTNVRSNLFFSKFYFSSLIQFM